MPGRRLVCDVTDLLAHFRDNRGPVGVSRVQMALLEAGLADPPLLEVVAAPEGGEAFHRLPARAFAALAALARAGGPADEPAWLAARRAAERALAEAEPFAFRPGDALASLGAAWWVPGLLDRFRRARERHGARLVFLFYDAIPLAVPEHCDAALVGAFRGHALSLCLHADLVVAISAQSAREFAALRRAALPGVEVPVEVLGLDAPLPPPPDAPPRVALPGRPYALCVSTVESRKNQAFLLHGWLALIRRHGERHVPDLVLVGRRGHAAEEALRLLAGAPELRRKARHLEGVGDADLARLYAGSLFAVFNSFHEGWGLPVTEAISHGRVPLAPDLPALREAGGDAAVYFEPQNLPDFCEAAWRLARDERFRRGREAELPSRRPLRTWRALAEALRDAALAGGSPPLPPPAGRAALPLGERVAFRRGAGLSPAAAAALGAAEGWWPAEDWGLWARPGTARLRLALAEPLAEPALLHLELLAPHGVPLRPFLRVTPPGGAPAGPWLAAELDVSRATTVRLPVPPCPAGELVVELEAGPGASSESDPRALGPGLVAVMLCARSDRAARHAYLEALANLRDAEPG